ncbi:DUF4492 domain-containing protein [Prolixibacteraceae bacterium]|uniref:DUF4492 domain-containing protein n=1 Tax=Halosquirtibacter xylanolyticus TaxID=3374599 RepID=UPI003749899A|nr:DUF4492 domain-containing protein [Prolixibacteraceae bacterium]QZT36454.1 DUF4492 domain-containing protein [Prolixibacteraceae bacterium]
MNIFKRVFQFYYQGFKSMTWGKQAWAVILVKLFVMFFVLKLFFFPNKLNTEFTTDQERSSHVIDNLTNIQTDNK